MKYTDGKNIMVYAQSADVAPVGAARDSQPGPQSFAKANGEEVIAVVFGKDTDTKTVITAGASRSSWQVRKGLQARGGGTDPRKTCGEISAEGSLYGRNPEEDDRPAVSAVFESGCVTDVTGITADGVYTSLSYKRKCTE